MLVPEALRYQTYKTCTLALCRPDAPASHLAYKAHFADNPNRACHWQAPVFFYATMLIINTIISPTTELTSSSRPQVFNVSFTDRSK